MQAANPYRAPKAAVGDMDEQEYEPVRTFSASGRIGRVRYLAYSIGWTLLFSVIAGIIAAALGKTGAPIVVFAAYAALLVIQILLAIQRSHDFDTSGWLCLLIFVPLVNLLFLFIPGTSGSNRFGAPTPPNSTGVIVVALILPAVFVIGIVAAIALPAYQHYVERAKTVQHN